MPSVNDGVRVVVIGGLSGVPVAGGLISGIVGLLWPASAEDIWGEIKARVEALIQQRISDLVYQQVKEDLDGLKNVVADYTQAVSDSSSNITFISEKYNVALGAFETSEPHFMSRGYEVLLLPLFAQRANLYLALARDSVRFGVSWGWTTKIVADMQATLTAKIAAYVAWANRWYQTGLTNLPLPGDSTYRIENWNARNNYVRQMTLDVLDHAHFWPSYDPAVNPGGDPSKVRSPQRTIYSNTIGTADDTGVFIAPPPTGRITAMNVWAWNYLDAIQVAYDGVWGPRLGDQPRDGFGGSNQPPHGWNGDIFPTNPIKVVMGRSGQLPDGLQLGFKDGSFTNLCGRLGGGGYEYRYDGHILSSVDVMGVSNFYGSANCVVFGFRYEDSY